MMLIQNILVIPLTSQPLSCIVLPFGLGARAMVFNVTFNDISVIGPSCILAIREGCNISREKLTYKLHDLVI